MNDFHQNTEMLVKFTPQISHLRPSRLVKRWDVLHTSGPLLHLNQDELRVLSLVLFLLRFFHFMFHFLNFVILSFVLCYLMFVIYKT